MVIDKARKKGKCVECGKEFEKGHERGGKWYSCPHQKLCSKECREKSINRTRVPKITKKIKCQHCGKEFEKTAYEKAFKHIKYCSKECLHEATKENKKIKSKGVVKNASIQIHQTRSGFLEPKNVLEFQVGSQVYVPDYRFGYQQYCTYCGSQAQSIDHCVAWAYISALGARKSNVKGITTHACFKCNSKLNDRMFDTFIERVIFMRSYYSEVMKRYFGDWTMKEIEQQNFDYTLKTYIMDNYYTREQCEQRIKWTETKEFKEIMDQNKFSIVNNIEKFTPGQKNYLIDYFNLNENLY